MPAYTNPGPQQFAMHQQSRKDDWIRQLLQLFMMQQQRDTEEERWGKEHELSERRTKAYETQAETQKKQAEQPEKPSAFAEKFMTAYKLTGDAQKAYQMATNPSYKPPKTPEEIQAEADARAKGAGTGKYAKKKTPEEIRADAAARAQGAGTGKFKPPTAKKGLTPAQKLTTRRIIGSAVNKTFVDIQNIDSKAFENPEQIEAYRARAEIDIDMPPKYTKVKRYMEQGVAKPEEEAYFNKATAIKKELDLFPEIYSLADISPALRKEWGADSIIESILSLRKKPGKNIFQKLLK